MRPPGGVLRYWSQGCRRRGLGDVDAELGRTVPARMALRRLVDRGEVEITQDGRVVDPSTAKRAIRLRRTR